MRIASLTVLLALLATGLMGCAQTRSVYNKGKQQVASLTDRVRGCCPTPSTPTPQNCAPSTQPQQCICWSEPVYNSCCGGDNGIGRGGTGAFKVP